MLSLSDHEPMYLLKKDGNGSKMMMMVMMTTMMIGLITVGNALLGTS